MLARIESPRLGSHRLRLAMALGLGGWMGLAAVACDPGEPEGSGSSSDTDPTGEPGTTTTATSTGESSSDASSGDETGPDVPADPCMELASDQCRDTEGCMVVEALRASDTNACDIDVLFGPITCVSAGGPVPFQTTYYAEIDGVMRYLVVGQSCAINGPTAEPSMWTECTDAPGEPEPCHCLCGANGCPTDGPKQALEACEVDAPCGEVVEHEFGEPLGDYATCVLEALRDRSPGYFPFMMGDALFLEQTRVYATGEEQVQMVRRHQGDTCGSPLLGTWQPAMQCTLETPEFFDACLTGPPEQQHECLFGSSWFSDCQEVEPTCP